MWLGVVEPGLLRLVNKNKKEDKIMSTNYQWKIPSLAKNIPVDSAVEEFKRVEVKYGAITPENIVDAARPKSAILHPAFEWDDNRAAEQYRLQQARNVINNVEVKIISDSEERTLSVYEIVTVKDDGRQYKHIETFTINDIEQIKNATIESLKQLTHKLKIYKEFDKVIDLLQEAVNILSN